MMSQLQTITRTKQNQHHGSMRIIYKRMTHAFLKFISIFKTLAIFSCARRLKKISLFYCATYSINFILFQY